MSPTLKRFAGVDGFKKGWVIALADEWPPRSIELTHAGTFTGVMDLTSKCIAVAVDMPIGLPQGDSRRICDLAARTQLGRARSSVFPVPPRETLAAGQYARRRTAAARGERPDGLLHYENNIIFRLYPLHLGMRWYWRDFGSMERWTRSEPHRQWWQRIMRDSGGAGFWHEVYLMRGGMEGVYADLNLPPVGFQGFAPSLPAHGGTFSARQRLQLAGETPAQPSGVAESDLG